MPISPDMLHNLAEAALDAVVLVDDQGVIQGFNEAASTTFGYSESEAIGSRMLDLMIPPRLREAHQDGWDRYSSTGEKRLLGKRVQIHAMRKGGDEFPVELTVTHMQLGATKGFIAFIRDLSEAKQAAEQLAMTQFAMDRAADAVLILEKQTQICYANRQAATFAGADDGELVGKNFLELYPDIIPEDWGRQLSALPQGERFCLETRHVGAAGRVRSVAMTVSKVHVGEEDKACLFCRDITQRQELDEALYHSLNMWETSFNAFPSHVSILDQDGKILRANRAMREAFEPVHGRLDSLDFRQLYCGQEENDVELPHAAVLAGSSVAHAELEFPTLAGWYRVSAFPLYGRMEELIGAVSVVQDITANKEFEAELTLRREQAEQANRVKSEFLAIVSHEMRTPLNAIAGTLELFDESELDSSQRELRKICQQSTEQLSAIISDILDFSQIEAGKLVLRAETFDVLQSIDLIIGSFNAKAARLNLDLPLVVEKGVPRYAIGDAGRYHQILTNLLSNALRFTTAGSVGVNVSVTDECDNHFTLKTTVVDTGIGIAEQEQLTIFNSFEQVEDVDTRTRGGVGLGLAICHRLVEMMGGRIWVESDLGEGAKFSFEIQLQQVGGNVVAADIEEPAVDEAAPKLQDARILFAEDDVINARVIEAMLQKGGHQVEVARNGHEVMEIYGRNPQGYDLLILDMMMPGMSGLEVVEALHEQYVDCLPPIVALTARATQSEREICLVNGFAAYLMKPVSADYLLACIENLVAGVEPPRAANGRDTWRLQVDLAALLHHIDYDRELLEALYEALKDLIVEFEAATDFAQANGDWQAWGELMHRVKGASRNLQAVFAATTANTLELAANRGDTQLIHSLLPRFKRQLVLVAREINQLISEEHWNRIASG